MARRLAAQEERVDVRELVLNRLVRDVQVDTAGYHLVIFANMSLPRSLVRATQNLLLSGCRSCTGRHHSLEQLVAVSQCSLRSTGALLQATAHRLSEWRVAGRHASDL